MVQDIARPYEPSVADPVDLYEVCRKFIAAYSLPALPPDAVIQGWQNRSALPSGTNRYAVISVLWDRQHGTTVEDYSWNTDTPEEVGRLSVRALVEVAVQIDFCAENDLARVCARRVASITRSSIGAQFFNDWGISALYADDARDISFVGDAKQFVRRWTTTLHLALQDGIKVKFEAFDNANASRVEDVDVHHKP